MQHQKNTTPLHEKSPPPPPQKKKEQIVQIDYVLATHYNNSPMNILLVERIKTHVKNTRKMMKIIQRNS